MAEKANTIFLREAEEPRPARRGFLRTLITAPAAALATHKLIVPAAVPIITPDEAAARLKFHMAGLEQAFRDLFPGVEIVQRGNVLNGGHQDYAERFAAGDNGYVACAIVLAGPGKITVSKDV